MTVSNVELERHLAAIDGVMHVQVSGDGYHYELTIVSDCFVGKTRVARQQWVYAWLNHYITSGQLHAIRMKTWTIAEWEKQHG